MEVAFFVLYLIVTFDNIPWSSRAMVSLVEVLFSIAYKLVLAQKTFVKHGKKNNMKYNMIADPVVDGTIFTKNETWLWLYEDASEGQPLRNGP